MNLRDIAFLARTSAGYSDAPNYHSGLSAWWRADDLNLADGDPVAAWNDRTANANHLTQATAANKPTLKTAILSGRPVVRFDGADSPNNDFLAFTAAIALAADFCVIGIFLVNADSLLFGLSSANRQFRRYESSVDNISIYDGTGAGQSSAFDTAYNAVVMASWTRSGTTIYFRENKTARGTSSSALSISLDRMGVTTPFFNPLNGDVAEACIYTAALTTGELDSLYDRYFKPRWGLP